MSTSGETRGKGQVDLSHTFASSARTTPSHMTQRCIASVMQRVYTKLVTQRSRLRRGSARERVCTRHRALQQAELLRDAGRLSSTGTHRPGGPQHERPTQGSLADSEQEGAAGEAMLSFLYPLFVL